MMRIVTLTAVALFAAGAAHAAGSHEGGHGDDDHHGKMAVGEPGKMHDVHQRMTIIMKETEDGDMIFEPSSVNVTKGETILFVVKNVGELEHEFVLDDHKGVMEHKAMMEKFPEMEHDDPNSVRLDPGKTGEVVWKFSNEGNFEFACLIPGHYDSGMKGDLTVAEKTSSN